MAARATPIARPLLGWRRAETHALCAALGLPVLDDPMNDDVAFRRVAIRHEVLPLLDRVAGRDLMPVLARQAALLREETEFLDALAASRWPGPDGRAEPTLRALPPVLARRALRNWLGAPPPSADEVARVLAVVERHRAGGGARRWPGGPPDPRRPRAHAVGSASGPHGRLERMTGD